MYSVIDVCEYIIYYSNKRNYSLSNLKLQKLLYFVQAYFLIKFNDPCFAEDIEAWDFGPVVPVAYHVYKRFGAGEIPYAFGGTYNGHISLKSQNAIAEVIDSLAKYSASDLVRVTHGQDPWKNVYHEDEKNIKIGNSAIKEYFDGQ